MPEYLRALVVILVLAAVVFGYVQRPAFGIPIAGNDFRRRRNLWFFVTLLAFLAHDFYIYIVGVAIVLLATNKSEKNPLALFFILLFVAPPFSAKILGIGAINQIIEVNHIRLLVLAILLPAWLTIKKSKDTEPFFWFWADRFIFVYLFLQAALIFGSGNFTAELRSAIVYPFIDTFLPYYVASRAIRNISSAKDALSSLVVACFILGVIGVFELLRSWLLYSSLAGVLGIKFAMGNYLVRGDSGAIRALASTGHSIALGYVLAVSIFLYQFTRPRDLEVTPKIIGSLVLMAGLLVTLSRGPWVGFAGGLVVFTLMSPNRPKDISKLMVIALSIGIFIIISPYRDRLIDLLPFVGATDAGNVVYRQMLLENSLLVISQRPWFGGGDFYNQLASMGMMQGEGIVDLVNSYIGIALSQGCVGLALFVGFFVATAVRLFRACCSCDVSSENHLLGRSLMAALVAALITIATVSSILCIPTIYWALAGLCVGCSRFIGPASTSFDEKSLKILRT